MKRGIMVKEKLMFFLVVGALMINLGVTLPTPTAHSADVIKWKAQSIWSAGPGFQSESSIYFANALNRLTCGRLIIEKFHSAGELMGAMETVTAVSSGKIDVANTTMMYIIGKSAGGSFVAGTQASPLKSKEELLSWWWQNIDLWNQYLQEMGLNIVSFPMGPLESEIFWSIKPVRTLNDFRGLKVRSSGLSMDFYKRLGAATVTMPLGEVYPSLEKGVIDACEFTLPFSDYYAGVHKTCKYALMGLNHQPAFVVELAVNRDSWNKLSDDLKQAVKDAVNLTNMNHFTKVTHDNCMLWQKMIQEGRKGGLVVTKAPPEMQKKFFEIGEEMAREWAAKDPWVKKFLESQTEYHKIYSEYMGTYHRAYPEK